MPGKRYMSESVVEFVQANAAMACTNSTTLCGFLVRTGAPRRWMPHEFPTWATVYQQHGADWPQVLDGSQWHRQAINQYETYDPLLSLVLSLDDGKATGCLPMF